MENKNGISLRNKVGDCKRALVQSSYTSILKLVKDGWNISTAAKKMNIHPSSFYGYISESQKNEIYYAKKLHTKYGVGSSKH